MQRPFFRNVMTLAIVAVASLVMTATSAHASLVINSVTVSGFSAENGGFNRLARYTVDGSGLSGNAHNNTASGGMWMQGVRPGGDKDGPAFIIYDLGGVFEVDSFNVWNYNEFLSNRGFKDVVVTFGQTAALGSTLASVTQFAQAPGTNGYLGQLFSFSPITARFIRFEGLNNYGGDEIGLAEVRFFALIPEPATASLGLLSACGLMLRRRRMA